MTDTRYLILYVDDTGKNRYMYCDDSEYIDNNIFDTEKFLREHPDMKVGNIHVKAIFCENDDLIYKTKNEETEFRKYCYLYDFEPHEYKIRIRPSNTNKTLLLVGFLPQNRKYKALLRNEVTGRMTKATLDFVRKYAI